MGRWREALKSSRQQQRRYRWALILVSLALVAAEAARTKDDGCGPRPVLDPIAFPLPCVVVRKVCIDQQTLITYDPEYENVRLPEVPFLRWNFPSGVCNTDAISGAQPWWRLTLRRASALDPPPRFSKCSTPLVLMHDWAFNVGEFMAEALTCVHMAFKEGGLDPRITLVYAVPEGLAPMTYHRLLLGPYTQLPMVPLWEVGMAEPGRRVPWTWEGEHYNCFEELALCKWQGGRTRDATPLSIVGAELVEHLGKDLPPDPLRFGGSRKIPGWREQPIVANDSVTVRESDDPYRKKVWKYVFPKDGRSKDKQHKEEGEAQQQAEEAGGAAPKMRVLIESRRGFTRNLKNLDEVLDACKQADKQGFAAGPFRGIECRAYSFSEGNSTLVGREHFRANMAAVRSAHVLVMQHGAGAINSFFMPQGDEGPSALVEMRPCDWGGKYGYWPDTYEPLLHARTDSIRVYAYNVEDRQQCEDSEYIKMMVNGSLPHHLVTAPGAMRARDQHITVQPEQFMEILRHVGDTMADINVYLAARREDRLHAYARRDGIVYGPLGIKDLNKWLKQKRKQQEKRDKGSSR